MLEEKLYCGVGFEHDHSEDSEEPSSAVAVLSAVLDALAPLTHDERWRIIASASAFYATDDFVSKFVGAASGRKNI